MTETEIREKRIMQRTHQLRHRRAFGIFALFGLVLAGCSGAGNRDSYVVFFERDSVSLPPYGKKIIYQAAAEENVQPSGHITITAAAGDNRTPQALQALARARAKAVADELRKDGVSSNRISFASYKIEQMAKPNVMLRRVQISLD